MVGSSQTVESTDALTVTSSGSAQISGVSPTSGQSGTTLTISGGDLTNVISVMIGDAECTDGMQKNVFLKGKMHKNDS